jgi:hypothetical protein
VKGGVEGLSVNAAGPGCAAWPGCVYRLSYCSIAPPGGV